MRKYILIAALVLVSATAQARVTRGLTLASNDEPAAVEQSKAAEEPKPVETTKPVEAPKTVEVTKPAEAPKFIERPTTVDTTSVQPKADQAKPVSDKNSQPLKAEKPKRKRVLTEARVIYELHRHGIYW